MIGLMPFAGQAVSIAEMDLGITGYVVDHGIVSVGPFHRVHLTTRGERPNAVI